ncbi:hypothetical protein QVD17_22328 [Tagetes erecta]|uniref:Uncharacterized protein n=1 Tax=Tagetes erecta TaxID=13708 RepID=A0AAD8KG02_TARER|nr:hypothetical protein QVD17_22328 [Tagetes erecta]
MGGIGISSTPSLLQSSDLEKTQAELRQSFTVAEEFRRELEFLQKGGDPLDLKPGNTASVSFQSTSLVDRHPGQFVTSEAKGSFVVTASPHGDSVESSGRLGAPSVCEPNSADNLMLLKESGDSAVLELPKKSYKRRVRSRPGRDTIRQASRDSKALAHDANVAVKKFTSHLENELDGVPALQSSLGPAHGPYSAVLGANENDHASPAKSDGVEAPLTVASVEPVSIKVIDQVHLTDSKGPTKGNTEEIKSIPGPIKILDSESSCTQTGQHCDDVDRNGLPMEQNLASNTLGAEKNDKILNIDPICNEDGLVIKEEEGLKGTESVRVDTDGCNNLKSERKTTGPNSISQDGNTNDTPLQESTLTVKHATDGSDQNTCSTDNLKLATKEYEDSVLEEARIIEAKRKRIAELSFRNLPMEKRLKSHWDFVLEEMSWLANDFAQERVWKITAAAQLSRRVAFASQLRFHQQSLTWKQKEISHNLAEAVMQFWHLIQVKCKGPESESVEKEHAVGVQGYAMRFMEFNNSQAQYNATQAPVTHDVLSDLSMLDYSWEDNLTEENLFYTVPPGAIEAYKKAIDSHLQQFQKTGISMQEEVDTSCYDSVADNAFEEDGETNTYYFPGGFEASKSTKNAQKRRKNFKFYGPRAYETGADVPFVQSAERAVGTQPSVLSGKRSGSSLNVTIPTKRMRTASRQRVISSFNAGTSGHIHALNKADASSADTNSFQDEQSSLHGVPGPQILNNMEAESAGDYEKQLQFDSMEVSNRPKKKKKEKHPGSVFEQRWQHDSNFHNDQKDHIRRRLDTHQFDSNGTSVASQMSNMSNPNKFMKLLVRDHSKKVKALKTPVGQPGSGSPWSLFEDQALVVLVHDMGPNWELISDAINSTLQFKCIFRKPNECKERHKILMDMNADGADSAEDSVSSQPYPSTLPGIPEGSARQLFQRLQGPMEEATLKSHFEKIIMLGQKQHYRRTQNDNYDPKQIQKPHSSHAFALSQVCPNNLNGGPVLTPLELSEAVSSSPDVLPVGYQGPHSGGLPALNHGSVAPMLPGAGSGSGSTSSAPGSSSSFNGSNIPSTSAPLNPSVREGRYGIPRTGSLSVDDQQRMQQYNRMLSARNAQQSSLPPGSHSVNERGVRILPAGSGMGSMCGVNRNMKMTRPGFQGIPSPSMLASGSATPSPPSIHSGSGPGNSMLRPRDPMHLIRANQNTDQKVSQSGTTQGVPSFGTNQVSQQQSYPRAISPQQSPHMLNSNSHHPHHFQGSPNHHANPAYAMRLAKERQLQQQRLLQQQQQFSAANPMMPHVQPQESQLPVSSPQNSAANSSSPPVSISPSMTPKHPGLVRNPQASSNQLVKQQRPRPSQQFQPHQQNQAKLLKGGRGNLIIHQNLPTDSSLVNGFPGSSAGKQSIPHNSLSQPHQQKTFSGQTQAASSKNAFDSSDNSKSQDHGSSVVAVSSNHQQQLNQKLVNQKQATSQKILLINRKANTSDQTSKLGEPPMSLNTSSQPSTPVITPNATCNDANNTDPPVASATPAVNADAVVAKNPLRVSPPKTSGVGVDSEPSEPSMNQAMVHRRSSSDNLPNPVDHDWLWAIPFLVGLSFPCKSNLEMKVGSIKQRMETGCNLFS